MFVQQMKEELVGQQENIQEQQKNVTKSASWYHANKVEIGRVAVGLKKVEVTRAVLSLDCVDLSITGDRHTLNAIFAAFRKLEYEPSDRPTKEHKPTFSCYWNHPVEDAKFWLYFTSNKCTRVKVGTETKEVDIYEVVCE